ncbi:MAG: acyl-CoA thioesterase [Halobacteriaceae archaeon]
MADLLDTYIENRSPVQPQHANNHGTVHGGNVMRWMDEVGALAATRHAGETVVTASIAQLNFERPVPIGETVLIRAYVYATGRTSMRAYIEAFREQPRTGDEEQTTASHFVFVAVDEDGKPVEVPEVTIGSERGEKLRQAAREDEPHSLGGGGENP